MTGSRDLPPRKTQAEWRGGRVDDVAECVLAPNPGPMTLDGTNTWLLAAPGGRAAVVVDPGPAIETHLAAVLAAAERRDVRIGAILLTHGHHDHSAGAARLRELTGAPVRALDRRQVLGSEGLAAGTVIDGGGLRIEVVATPGHTGDSLSFVLPGTGAVLTGDTVLGRGTAVVAYPDGRLADYLASLRRVERLCTERSLTALLPGHGPAQLGPAPPPVEVVRYYLRHRQERLDQVRTALAAGARTAEEVVEAVYQDVPPAVRVAAELSVRAQLEYLGGNDGE
jgi:glyoxylase-like metal-dependent hydrolase (beta-lactamase superfamily II)